MVEEILQELRRERIVFENSGGGVTFSGGEPYLQAAFLKNVLQCCTAEGIDTCIETTLFADWNDIEPTLPYLSHILCDVKHPDSDVHRKWTGVGNERILSNAKKIIQLHPDVTVRIPVIPGFNTTSQARDGFISFFGECKPSKIELLPYHIFGESKYALLHREYPGRNICRDEAANDSEKLCAALLHAGFSASVSK